MQMNWFSLKPFLDLILHGDQSILIVVVVTAGVMLVSYMFWNHYYYKLSTAPKRNIRINKEEDDCTGNGLILLFYNPKAGSFKGSRILSRVKKHHDQVLTFCISDPSLSSTLKSLIPSSFMRIVICGGDISFVILNIVFLMERNSWLGTSNSQKGRMAIYSSYLSCSSWNRE